MRHLLVLLLLAVWSSGADAPATKLPLIDVAGLKAKAEAGDAGAQVQLGAAYASGHGVTKNLDEAMKWNRLAYEQGDLDGQCAYAALLLKTGSKKNTRLAVELYRKAAQQNHPLAMFYVGSFYYSGFGVGDIARDPFLGAQWYEKAAFAGHPTAQFNVGVLLASEDGPVKQNLVDGLAWLMIASAAGDKGAIEARDKLMKEVKPAVVPAAQARMQEFKSGIERIKRARESAAK